MLQLNVEAGRENPVREEMDEGNYIYIFHRREAIDTASKSGKSGLGVLFKNKKAYDRSAI